jgi:peptidyl-prolyl cis-trans isomerase A (cyclophilin A)
MKPLAVAVLLSIYAIAPAAVQSPNHPPKVDLTNVAAFTAKAPDVFNALFTTTAGTFVVKVTRAWAPNGADRFYNLVKNGFYDDCRFFRVIPKFMAQFGIHGDPKVSAAWKDAMIPHDRARMSNTRGRVTFAQGLLASSRSTQVFINFSDNSRLDKDSFAPFGEVTSSMIIVERLFGEYGEGIDQSLIQSGGNALLAQMLPRLDYIKTAVVEERRP